MTEVLTEVWMGKTSSLCGFNDGQGICMGCGQPRHICQRRRESEKRQKGPVATAQEATIDAAKQE